MNREEERYQVEKLEASREQVKYSPIDEINKSERRELLNIRLMQQ